MSEKMDILEVNGADIVCTFNPMKKRTDDLYEQIEELKSIICKKNEIIEKQTDYIADLQDENHNLRSTIKMLTL